MRQWIPPNTLILTTIGLLLASCSSIERARPRPKAASSVSELDASSRGGIMRGTVGAETVILGWDASTNATYKPVKVHGYGLVVGLEGTGSGDVPADVRTHMLQLMARQGVGSERIGYGDVSAEDLLASPDTAIVIVEGTIPPGAVGMTRTPPVSGRLPELIPGTHFDVHVYADPRTGTTSLEGGRLYTTNLTPGPLMTGDRQARVLARAAGPIFLNPFVERELSAAGDINTLSGRSLNGGQATEDMPLKLVLLNPSHARTRIIQDAINKRFPIERGQRHNTARGVSDSILELTVPPSLRNEPDRFVHIVRHVTLRQVDTDRIANTIRRSLQSDPSVAPAAYWRWVALGPKALPMVRKMYDYPEALPRLASLRAGAALEDPIAADSLRTMLKEGSIEEQLEAAHLLAELPDDPRTEEALRALLDSDHVELRLRAYEALEQLGSPVVYRHRIPDKFNLHVAPSSHPTIYITQVNEPRIVLLGDPIDIERPMTLGMWDNALLMRESDAEGSVEIFYRPDPLGPAEVNSVPANLRELVLLMAHRPTVEDPRPGLGLSHSEVVGALHALWHRQYVASDFKAQQDRALAELRRASVGAPLPSRPE